MFPAEEVDTSNYQKGCGLAHIFMVKYEDMQLINIYIYMNIAIICVCIMFIH